MKPHCGWSRGVRAIMRKYNLEYEDIDILNNHANYDEMVRKSGQPFPPASRSTASCSPTFPARKSRTTCSPTVS